MVTVNASKNRFLPRRAGICLLTAALGLAEGELRADVFGVGDSDTLAIDQPRVTFGLTDESTNPATLIGPQIPGQALLDTGANGVLLANLAYRTDTVGLIDFGQPAFPFDYDGSGAIDPDEQLAQYKEQGVAGFSLLDVHDVHGLRVTDSDGNQILAPNVRAFGDSDLNFGSFNAIVGMPAMQGRVVEVDMRPSLGFGFQRVAFHNTIGQATFESAVSMDVDLRIVPPEHTDTTLPTHLRPTFAGLPVIDNVDMKHTGGANSPGGKQTANDYTFLVDTGAQTLIISEQMAADMGIDFVNTIDGDENGENKGDVVDFLEVGGIGGNTFMPVVFVDEFHMPTADGNFIRWNNISAGVLDIEGAPFDAVLGMNMLTTGYFEEVFLAQPNEHVFDKVVFDFTPTDGTATMRLDFFADPTALGDLDGDGTLTNADISAFILALTDPAGYAAAYPGLDPDLPGDFDGDGTLTNADIAGFVDALTGSASLSAGQASALAVPEPGTLMLMLAASATLIGWRRRRAA